MPIKFFAKCVVGVAILAGGWECCAQRLTLLSEQIRSDDQAPLKPAGLRFNAFDVPFASADPKALFLESVAVPDPSGAVSASAGIQRAPAKRGSRIFDSHYFLFNGLHLGMAVLDVAMTQHCMADHDCDEANPLMPRSLGAQLSVSFASVGYCSFISYALKKRHSRFWWTAPASGIAAHSVGVATGLANR